MHSDKCRTKAKKIAATASGVTSVALDGADKDQVVVVGEEVDSVKLARSLRKKVGHASLMSVEEEKDKEKEEEKEEKEKFLCHPNPYYYYSQPVMCEVVGGPNPNSCTVM
ncbi:HEAVY METAL-ASSOCIATED DOMAIN HMA-RELATED [Salix purpurea]|uniref:HEAVY METAL-ASSOCIATED DOMAIN HMA-RELATED n=1 Tax=Salix purpurea TaxID=77065 RepID=A0A9Q0VS10_SALPP|nr:HEAVY METAL-ASSOCIATED DOMAIN HMA-RELATED [Salix purpurea]